MANTRGSGASRPVWLAGLRGRFGAVNARPPRFRAFARRRARLRVVVWHPRVGWQAQADVSDLSLGGACVRTSEALVVGDRVTLSFVAPTLWDPLQMPSRVAWSRPESRVEPARAGVAFEPVDAAAVYALYELLGTLGYVERGRRALRRDLLELLREIQHRLFRPGRPHHLNRPRQPRVELPERDRARRRVGEVAELREGLPVPREERAPVLRRGNRRGRRDHELAAVPDSRPSRAGADRPRRRSATDRGRA